MPLETYIGTRAIIDHLARYKAHQLVALSITVVCPNYRSRAVYRGFLRLLDQQPLLTYTKQSSGKWWRRYRRHLVIAQGSNSALQAAFHQLQLRYGKQR